jgi:hypothetical protein
MAIDPPASTSPTDVVTDADNLWWYDDHTETDHLFVVSDFRLYGSLAEVETKPLGLYRGAPVVSNEVSGFSPAQWAFSVANLAQGEDSGTTTASTVRILAASASHSRCGGFLDGVNTSDTDLWANVGTLNVRDTTVSGPGDQPVLGGLGVLVSLSEYIAPVANDQSLGVDGLAASRPWTDPKQLDRIFTTDDHGRLANGFRRQSSSDDSNFVLASHRDAWRSWHSLYRLKRVADFGPLRRAYYDVARLAILKILATPAASLTPARKLSEMFTSEKASAILLYWHASFPDEVITRANSKFQAAAPVVAAINDAIAAGAAMPPASDDDEQKLFEALVDKAHALHPGGGTEAFREAMTALRDAPEGELGAGLNSRDFDFNHMPCLPIAVASGVVTAAVQIGPPPTHAGGTSNVAVCLVGQYDGIAQTFFATDAVFLVRDSAGDDQGATIPLASPRMANIQVEDVGRSAQIVRGAGQTGDEFPVMRILPGDLPSLTWLEGEDWELLPNVFGETAFDLRPSLQFASLAFDGGGDVSGRIRSHMDAVTPFGMIPLSLAAAGDNGADEPTFRAFNVTESASGIEAIAAMASGLKEAWNALTAVPFRFSSDLGVRMTSRGSDFFALFEPSATDGFTFDLIKTLVDLTFDSVLPYFSLNDGVAIRLPDATQTVAAGLSANLFAAVDSKTVIGHDLQPIGGGGFDFSKLFRLNSVGPDRFLSLAQDLIRWDGDVPQMTPALFQSLTDFDINADKRLRNLSGELFGPTVKTDGGNNRAAQMHAKFQKPVGPFGDLGVEVDRNEDGDWAVKVPMTLRLNDDQNHAADESSHERRDILALTGLFSFVVPDNEGWVRFAPGTFAVDPNVRLIVHEPEAKKGRSFAGMISVHVPDKTVFDARMAPTDFQLAWNTAESKNNGAGPIIVRVPASEGATDLNEAEERRFTFEMQEFGIGSAGFDLAGEVRVEEVSLNRDAGDSGRTGLAEPLTVQKAESKSPNGKDDTPLVGTLRFQKSRLTSGSLRAGFKLRYFDDATGTIQFAFSEDVEKKELRVVGIVEINHPVEYRLAEIYSIFQLSSVYLAIQYKRTEADDVAWNGDGGITGAIKFEPPSGKAADGDLKPLADFFAGTSCSFENLNPVRMGLEEFQIHFPARTFNLANVMEVDLNGIRIAGLGEGQHNFGLLGDVRLMKIPGVDGTLTFGGIELDGAGKNKPPKISIKKIGALLKLPGGITVAATFEPLKTEQEVGFQGEMAIQTDTFPMVRGDLKCTAAKTGDKKGTVPTLVFYLGFEVDIALAYGFYLRGLGFAVGVFQAMKGLENKSLPINQRITNFVEDPEGMPDPSVLSTWRPDTPPSKGKALTLNLMLAARAVYTYGKFDRDQPHILAGTLVAAMDQSLTLTLATNVYPFTAPDEVSLPEFRRRPAARGALQISPKEGKAFGYFRTLPNPKMNDQAPELLGQVLSAFQTTLAFLADGNGFLVEVGWP